jgi:hypothetical protein
MAVISIWKDRKINKLDFLEVWIVQMRSVEAGANQSQGGLVNHFLMNHDEPEEAE